MLGGEVPFPIFENFLGLRGRNLLLPLEIIRPVPFISAFVRNDLYEQLRDFKDSRYLRLLRT